MRLKRLALMALALLLISPVLSRAGEIGGVRLPETLEANGHALVLNGAGLRKKFFIKVYAGGLYLPAKTGDAAAIIDADQPMAIRMHFIYDGVSAEKLVEIWNEGFANATGGNTAPLADRIAQFNGMFTGETKKGEVYDLTYLPGQGVSVARNGAPLGRVAGLDFKKALFGIWLGQKPADDGLKEGMLGR